jgi:hypothetical protein
MIEVNRSTIVIARLHRQTRIRSTTLAVPIIGTQAPSEPASGYNTTVRIGLSTPVVIEMPGVASAWEAAAGIDDIARIAVLADGLGFDYLTCSEHVALPLDAADGRGTTYRDPLATAKATNVLGWQPRPTADTVADTGESLLRLHSR